MGNDNWISVKDKLPDIEEHAICFVCTLETVGDCTGYGREMAFYTSGTDAKGDKITYFKAFYDDALIENVVYWMPLPEPPRNSNLIKTKKEDR